MRLIDADKIPYVQDATYMKDYDYAYRYAIEAEPTVDAIPFKWIPCNERLPEEAGTYLVTVNYHGNTYVYIDNFHPSGWGWDAIGLTRLAWAKVPEPYKGESK